MANGHTPNFGYTWKLCPFSKEYKENYTDNGWDGNSNYHSLPVNPSDVTDHTTTSGTMVMSNRGGGYAGWTCMDPNCGYYLKYGKQYFEV